MIEYKCRKFGRWSHFCVNSIIFISLFLLLWGCAIQSNPLTGSAIKERAAADQKDMFADQEAVDGPISIEEAMARAIKYNLDLRLKMMESALSIGIADVARYNMLPNLVASAGYTSRNNDSGGTSINIETGEVSLAPSTSQERDRRLASAEFSWNILDFGVGYFRAREQANHYLISEENRRRVMQNILQEVRITYWQALGAQQLKRDADDLYLRAHAALERSRQAEIQGLTPPREALSYQRMLLDAISMIIARQQELDLAKAQLAALMNLPSNVEFTLVDMEEKPLKGVPGDIAKLEELALVNRPELRQEDYHFRISADEARRQLLALVPGLGLTLGGYYDSNSYLHNNSWYEAGIHASVNLLKMVSLPAVRKSQAAQVNLNRTRRMALSMAILTQVRVSVGRYQLSLKNLDVARESNDVDQRLVSFTKAAANTSSDTELEQIRAEVRALNSAYQRVAAYADAQAAFVRIYNSLGCDVVPGETIEGLPLDQAGKRIAAHLETIEASIFPAPKKRTSNYPPIGVRVEIPKGEGLETVDAGTVCKAVEQVLARNRVGLLESHQPGPRLEMILHLNSPRNGVRKAFWEGRLMAGNDMLLETRRYHSTLPENIDNRILVAFAEAAVIANINQLDVLTDGKEK